MLEKLATAAKYIQSIKKSSPEVGIILGSGLGVFVDQVENATIIPYEDIPFFGETTVEGHQGRLVLGTIEGVEVAIMQGRYHRYEGLSLDDVVFPVRVLSTLGADKLIVTNASGGINQSYKAGQLVVIDDHINFTGSNPLAGPNNSELGPRFPDMSYSYNQELNAIIDEASKDYGQKLERGVYAGVLGPSYETPAEVRMLRILGADMVGMSTVPEVIAANHIGMKVCGISCITNMAAGIEDVELNHQDVKDEALKVVDQFSSILKGTIARLK
jgi:purine-nucleoside phosphorylase